MSVASMIVAGRARIEDRYIDEGEIVRPAGGERVFDPTTQTSTAPDPVTVYVGRCFMKKPTAEEIQEVFGDVSTSVQRRLLTIPHDAELVHVGDIFQATVSLDAEVLRRPMRVVAVMATSTLMFRRLAVEMVEDN